MGNSELGTLLYGSGYWVGEMKIERFEDIEAWRLARELTRKA